MKISRFRATGVHGYLNLDIRFFPDLTFLTGINGSGKTTVVNGMSALISPSLAMLAHTSYESMSVVIEHDNDTIEIAAIREEDGFILRSSLDDEQLRLPVLDIEGTIPSHHAFEREQEFYREQEARYATHPVLKRLKALPTPMFLGLERRSSSFFFPDQAILAHSTRRRVHNVFSTSVARSLAEASSLAERSYNLAQARQRDLTDGLKKQFILSALRYEPALFSQTDPPSLDPDSVGRVRTTLRDIGLSDGEITKHLDPFVEKLRQISEYLPFDEDVQRVMSGDDSAKAAAYLEWFTNKPQFDRLTSLLREVDRYIANAQRANRALTAYLETLNAFFRDSSKAIGFSRTGSLTVSIEGRPPCELTALSSGESQLVVILTHLAFNPAAHGANVFIVDEPELSLHLRWQELFVAAIRKLNPKLQAILATHSPAIILDDVDHCVELSKVVR